MRWTAQSIVGLMVLGVLFGSCKSRNSGSGLRESAGESVDDKYYEGYGLSAAEERGRRVWYEATGDNGRFHTYILGQKIGAPADWHKVLGTKNRDKRWTDWGLIPDPDCKPGNDATYGFDICPGDEGPAAKVAPEGYTGLLQSVGKKDWKDPGCWITGSYREEDCALGLGTSTGVLGYRKFPNPRFEPSRWQGWESYTQVDGSIEPPFYIGTACGSCHITFNPLDPPSDPNHPKWRNIKGLVGNQWQHMEEVITAGLDPHTIEWQGIVTARAGAVDTSAHSNDLLRNPNTVNSIINTDRRPPGLPAFSGDAYKSFDKVVIGEGGKEQTQRVFNILKGGEDDVGGSGAIMRVYINEGMCSEPCWMNHLLDNRSIAGRGSEQTPFSVAQCRRDCPAYRAVEARFPEVLEFFVSKAGRPTDLKDALFSEAPKEERYKKLVTQLGEEKVRAGRVVFAKECAKCHSSLKPPEGQRMDDFLADLVDQAESTTEDPFLREENGVRVDWLGNEEREAVTKIGTNRCRSLHSNHQRGHIWDEFSSETYKRTPTPEGIPELKGIEGGGRGYYRNPSLLSVWTQAPFMHNNAVGPEMCNRLRSRDTPCVDKDAVKLGDGRVVSNISVEGRLKVFDDSMDQLLNPAKRGEKVTRTDADIEIPLGPQAGEVFKGLSGIPYLSRLGVFLKLWGGSTVEELVNVKLRIPKGTPVVLLGSLDFRALIVGIAGDLENVPKRERPRKIVELLNSVFSDPAKLTEILKGGPKKQDPNKYSGYSTCTDMIEDKGHEFGVSLSAAEKENLTAFLKTL